MGNPSRSAQAPGSTRDAHQALVAVFERDDSLAGLLIGQLRAQGYEGRAARTPVEVFDLIARYPVRLVLVNLGQAATSRREFWVALDAQRFGRGVQVITYRYVTPGVEPDLTDGGGRPDVEVRGPQGLGALVEAARLKVPPPKPPPPDSSFLVGTRVSGMPSPNGQPAPAAQPGASASPALGNPVEYAARQSIAGVLNLSRGLQPGQPPEFLPLSDPPGVSMMPPTNGGWSPDVNRTPPTLAAEAGAPGWPGALPRPERPGNGQMNGASFNPSMPMGDLAALSDAINALAAAGVPGYSHAAAAANAMNVARAPAQEPGRWDRGQQPAPPDGGVAPGRQAGQSYPTGAPPAMPEERRPSGSVGGMPPMNQGGQAAARGAAETLYMGQQAFAELGRAQDAPPQETRSRSLAGNGDDYDYLRRERPAASQSNGAEPGATPSRRLPEDREPPAQALYQNQMLAPIVAPGRIERSLGNVLIEGQLVSQQRLEVALGIQRLLRGVDIDYRLGEVLLLFKFLTHDQLLAALLVSRGLVTPAQVASMGRIKQELHAIGMEYDLENLLILFRLLSSEQLREVRTEFS